MGHQSNLSENGHQSDRLLESRFERRRTTAHFAGVVVVAVETFGVFFLFGTTDPSQFRSKGAVRGMTRVCSFLRRLPPSFLAIFFTFFLCSRTFLITMCFFLIVIRLLAFLWNPLAFAIAAADWTVVKRETAVSGNDWLTIVDSEPAKDT